MHIGSQVQPGESHITGLISHVHIVGELEFGAGGGVEVALGCAAVCELQNESQIHVGVSHALGTTSQVHIAGVLLGGGVLGCVVGGIIFCGG